MNTLAEYDRAIKDGRNIIDHYKYWTNEAIKADLDKKRHNFSVICWNTGYDFNVAGVIRSANAFLCKDVVIFQRKKFDRRGTVGTIHYLNMIYYKTIEELKNYFNTFELKPLVIAMENVPQAKDVNRFEFPRDRHVIFMFGQESLTLPDELLALCEEVLYIPQHGTVRSLNVASAATVAMNAYCRDLYL